MLFPSYGAEVLMPEGLWPVALLLAAFIAYVLVKVVFYVRKSDRQWQAVDRSKLKEWRDEEE